MKVKSLKKVPQNGGNGITNVMTALKPRSHDVKILVVCATVDIGLWFTLPHPFPSVVQQIVTQILQLYTLGFIEKNIEKRLRNAVHFGRKVWRFKKVADTYGRFFSSTSFIFLTL